MSYLTVREAARQLTELAAEQPDAILVQAEDPEGNGFRPVGELALGIYLPGGFSGGELWSQQGEEDDEGRFVPDDPNEEPPADARFAVVCWPGYDAPAGGGE